MKLNKLLNRVEDSYSDLYYLTKELLIKGINLSIQTESTNMKGLLVVRGPKTRKNIKEIKDILDPLGILILQGAMKSEFRTLLVSSQKNVYHLLFSKEVIELKIKTHNFEKVLTGKVDEELSYNKLCALFEEIKFEKTDSITFSITLTEQSSQRQMFEDSLNTDEFIFKVKKRNFNIAKNLVSRLDPKEPLNTHEIDFLMNMEMVLDCAIPVSEVISQAKDWLINHENNISLIKTFPSVTEQEKYAGQSWDRNTNYENVLKKYSKGKLL